MFESKIQHVTVPGLRLHLRRGDPSLLWVNGRDLLLVNQTAADFIEAFIEVMSQHTQSLDVDSFKQEIAVRMQKKYSQVPAAVLIGDFDHIYGSLQQVGQGNCPVAEVYLESKETHPCLWTAPPRMDLALTYRCNNNCYFCYTGGPQQKTEMSTPAWKRALDRLWQNGIPQVVFTGGEPTLREDLVELVDHAQEFVTGLVTNGRKLPTLAADLRRVSLDYVQVSLEAPSAEIHDRMVGVAGAWQETCDGIRAAVKAGLEVITNTTLTRDNLAVFPALIASGPSLGLQTMACNTLICSGRGTCSRSENGVPMEELKTGLTRAREAAQKAGINLAWYTPTCYKQFNPLEFGFGAKACSAAQYNMTIEPDGAVIPCQSWLKEKVGNILKDPWLAIWNHPVSAGLRNKTYLQDREDCRGCEYLPTCGGGCPLEHQMKNTPPL